MAAPNLPGPDDSTNPNADRSDPVGNLLPQPIYQVLRNYFLRPHDTVHMTRYFFQEWFTRLGLQRWLLVLVLRESLDSERQGVVRITREELAAYLECSEKTISDLLRHIPHATRKGWRVIDPNDSDGQPDPRRKALSLFIPRLRYWYEKDPNSNAPPKRRGFIIAVSMDDPLTPEDEARMRSLSLDQISDIVAGDVAGNQQGMQQTPESPKGNLDPSGSLPERLQALLGALPEGKINPSGAEPQKAEALLGATLKGKSDLSQPLKGSDDPITLTLTKLTKYIQKNIDTTLTSAAEIRRTVTPLVQFAETALADFHSTGMFYKVLVALYPSHLNLFVQAIGEALEVGEVDQQANLGAIFVESIKTLAQQAKVNLGFAGSEAATDRSDLKMEGQTVPATAESSEAESTVEDDAWTADGVWQEALSLLQLQMAKSTFDTWLYGTHGVDWDGERLVVELRNAQAQEWVENRMHPKIVHSVQSLVGHDVEVSYECRPALG